MLHSFLCWTPNTTQIQLSTVDFWNALVNHLGPKMLHAIFSSRQHEFLSHYKYFIDLFKDNKTTVKTFQIMNEIKTRSDDLSSRMIV